MNFSLFNEIASRNFLLSTATFSTDSRKFFPIGSGFSVMLKVNPGVSSREFVIGQHSLNAEPLNYHVARSLRDREEGKKACNCEPAERLAYVKRFIWAERHPTRSRLGRSNQRSGETNHSVWQRSIHSTTIQGLEVCVRSTLVRPYRIQPTAVLFRL